MTDKEGIENPKDRVGARKPPLDLVTPAGIIYEAMAMQDGAGKYGSWNWRKKRVRASVYIAACLRHLMGWMDHEEAAEDTGLPHLAHAKACLGILIDAVESGNLIDDRPTAGPAPKLLKEFTKDVV